MTSITARKVRRQHARQDAKARTKRIALVGAAAVGGSAALASSAEAAQFTVTNLDDAGAGSLRQAILDANVDATADTIVFASGLSGTIELTTGDIPIDAALDIQGPGADVIRVSGTDNSRHFDILVDNVGNAYDDVSISGLKLTDGDDGSGGSIQAADSDLTLSQVAIKGNVASSTGGGIEWDDGDLTISDSQIVGNYSGSGGGGVYFDGDSGTDDDLTVTDSVFANNFVNADGGAVYFDNGGEDLLVERSTVRDNTATGDGGGFDIYDPTTDAERSAVIRDSLVSGNLSESDEGGGVYYDGGGSGGAFGFLIENSTFAENRAYDGSGGGAYIGDTDAPVRVLASTFADNIVEAGGEGGGIYNRAENVALTNSIVAENFAAGTLEDNLGTDGNAAGDGSFVIDFSLIGDDTTATGSNILTSNPTAGSNLYEVEPQLGPLGDNGGPTLTYLPKTTSPAIDAGVAAGTTTDQRGLSRPLDVPSVTNRPGSDGSDMGAVELHPAIARIDVAPSGITEDANPKIAFSADDPEATFECSLDGAAFAPCTSPQTLGPLADGEHTFTVRATSSDGVTGPEAAATFTVDTRIIGAKASAKKTQKQKGKRIVVKLKAGAAEQVTATASGKIVNQGGSRQRAATSAKSFGLKPVKKNVAADRRATFKLGLKKKAQNKSVFNLLRKGRKLIANLQVKLVDEAGHSALKKLKVRLK